MGTPNFAAVILKALVQWPRGEIVAVYTQPDRPSGRGHKLTPSPVKRLAQELGLPVLQPQSLKNAEAQVELAALQPDVLVVAAYGLILPDTVLAAPRLVPINVHASLLPRYRGAAPIQRAIMENWGPDAQSGVAIMRVASRLDAGPVYADEAFPIGEHTAGSLHDVLSRLGAALLVRVLNDLLDGRAVAREQDESRASYAAKISKEDGYIDWERPAAEVHARIRGVTPWPGAHAAFALTGEAAALQLLLAPGEVKESVNGANPGDVLHADHGLSVACSDRWYRLSLVRPQNRKDMSVRDFINGHLRGGLPKGICGHVLRLG